MKVIARNQERAWLTQKSSIIALIPTKAKKFVNESVTESSDAKKFS